MRDYKKYNILLIAPAIDPNDVGEAFVGFKWAENLNEKFELTILTLTKKGHESILEKIPEARVISWNEPLFFWRFERFNSMFKPWYPFFYFKARQWIKKQLLINGNEFDLAFQLTPMAMRYPSPVNGLNIPYVMGPVGGGVASIKAFKRELKKVPWYTKFRFIDGFRLRYDPILRKTYFNASLIIGTAPHIKRLVEKFPVVNNVVVINENGVDKIHEIKRSIKQQVKLLYVGRVIRTKGVRDFIRAIALLDDSLDIHVDIVGDGEDLKYCQDEAKKLRSKEKIHFHGKLKRADVDKFYENADVFVFPSFREPSGGVVIEAMSYGIPQVVADYGGPASIVTNETGIKIKPEGVESYPIEIANAITTLVLNPLLRKKMSEASYKHVENNYLWENKIQYVSDLLVDLIERK